MADMMSTQTKQKPRADQYNDPKHNYQKYWQGREYEQAAEEVAIKKLLRGKHFSTIVDVGGGYGRLAIVLENYADKVILAEPSQQQLDMAQKFLKDHPKVERRLMQADDLKFADHSIDLVSMIRVLHHIPDPNQEFNEIARVLDDDGYALIEVANYSHALNRLKYWLKGHRMPVKPVDIRSPENRRVEEIPFVNHNPHTVIRQLNHAGLKVETKLSVSNLRSPRIKKVLAPQVMLLLESWLQRPLAGLYFGPSIFLLVRKGRL
ncbi:MAG TPA: class I SAM-dependent methyltransferase [Candidatus Dormibacteraeota bacterium]|nr:class I SAM-dependent methyltransferase [Candidatus Dormibacteraeota bacterium]